MTQFIKWLLLLLLPLHAQTQKAPAISIAFTNNHTAFPFGSFSRLFSGPLHPGVEMGYRFNWRERPKHDWFQTIQAGYFYHRFLQHAIPLYTQVGYRYKPTQKLGLSAAIAAGYLQSIPTTAILDLNDNGTYTNAKGLGRSQAWVHFSAGTQYCFPWKHRHAAVFFEYRQQIQTPFVKSYVPLLPYNSIALGTTLSISKNEHP